MTSSKKTLLWLEDVQKTVEEQINFARKIFSIELVSQLHDFAKILNEKPVKAIVLDIMLYRVYDLSDLGIKGVDTDMGYEAGWRVLEHYLRAPDSKFKDIPVLVLSVRAKREKDQELVDRLNKEGGAKIEFIEKREKSGGNKNFQGWIEKVNRGVQ
jgi:CheY-like chemotaxis protein